MASKGRPEIQLAVDEYVRLYSEIKELESKLDGLRDVIQPYMKQQKLEELATTDQLAKIVMAESQRPPMTARYTTYDVAEIGALLPPSVRKKCLVEVVDKDKLEALSKLGEIPDDVLAHKNTRTTTSLSVKYSKKKNAT